MQIIQSSPVRAIASIIIGALLIKYKEQTVTWIVIVIGALFLMSGLITCLSYLMARRKKSDVQVFDAAGNQISGKKPSFPVAGVGSALLGIILALMPNVFIAWLMFILAAVLIIAAVSQIVTLAMIARTFRVGVFYWISPSLILLVAVIALVWPSLLASAPLLVIGLCMLLYGLAECINFVKIYIPRNKMKAAAAAPQLDEPVEVAPEEPQAD